MSHCQIIRNEPPYDKTNKMACAPSKNSDSGHLPSLIRVFAVHMKKSWVLSYPLLDTEKTVIRLGAQSFCWFCHETAQIIWAASSDLSPELPLLALTSSVKRNLQTESQIPGPSGWLGMRS